MHACLIIAHNKFAQLQRLIEFLDDDRNEVFIHIDKKVKEMPTLKSEHSKIHLLENRIDVRWGDVSQIECELELLKEAQKTGEYNFYHLLSGVDLPIKSNDYIHKFFDEHANTQFIGHAKTTEEELTRKVKRYNLFTRHYKPQNKVLRKLTGKLRAATEFLVNTFFKRKDDGLEIVKGANWFSITPYVAIIS